MRRVANAQIVLTAPVEVTAAPVYGGAAAVGFTTTAAAPRKIFAVGGRCTIGLTGQRTVAQSKAEGGRGALAAAGRVTLTTARRVTGRCPIGLSSAIRPAAATGPSYAGPPTYSNAWSGQEGAVSLPPSYNLDVVCGQPLQVLIPVLAAGGAPVNSAQIASARAQVRATWQSKVLHEWTTTGGAPNASIGSGGVTLTATTAQTIDWQAKWPASVVWDLQVVDGSGIVHRLTSAGPVRLHPAITR